MIWRRKDVSLKDPVEFLTSRNILCFYESVYVMFVSRVHTNTRVGDAKHIPACGFTIFH